MTTHEQSSYTSKRIRGRGACICLYKEVLFSYNPEEGYSPNALDLYDDEVNGYSGILSNRACENKNSQLSCVCVCCVTHKQNGVCRKPGTDKGLQGWPLARRFPSKSKRASRVPASIMFSSS